MCAILGSGSFGLRGRSALRRPTLSYQRLQTEQPLTDQELHDKIRKTVLNKHELQVLESFLIFNKCVSAFFL